MSSPITLKVIFPIRLNPLIFFRGIRDDVIQCELGLTHPKTNLLRRSLVQLQLQFDA